ncbi:heme exporter protein CcmB [Natronobacterium gregoryi]|uniref:ABC-type transport system involved in cytochrome c biogenesis, permease component n=2 Tax=Natronobacterium gregoryi TaxID=44930 RepID=L0AMH8_NATGS|nr:heme exporter protein CcmB [Natronobacterium gregoryi]AFZ74260.1 ABC-type transport system involved in cytochrome c biogenesis, permease component [Natronobacterium gregoryi SP2]ELY63718.1 ABC-type transport system permease protein 1 (heme exporter protein B) [Natronobacterium gregoryi SP2]PLK21957.1 cytochrome C biogenesis protein [Natronobacterium gregoryi SP2]SFI52538.1 heme exporter protein B [Natronobacterium gregoryi]
MIGDYLRVVYAIARKDLLVESRSKQTTNAAVVFSLLIIVVFSFVFGEEVGSRDVLARGALWLAVVFGGAVGMSHAVALEGNNEAIAGLLLAPVDRSAIYLGKVASSTVFITGIGLLSLGFVVVFLDYAFDMATLATVLLVVPLAALGFSAVGVLLSILMLHSQLQESLLPVLLVPLVIPIILSGTALTEPGLSEGMTSAWLRILVTYDLLVLLAGWMTFEYVVEE